MIIVLGCLGYVQKIRQDVTGYRDNLLRTGWHNTSSSKGGNVYLLHKAAELNKIISYLVTIDSVNFSEVPLKSNPLSITASYHNHDFSIRLFDENHIAVSLPIPHGTGLLYSVMIDQNL